MTAFIARHLVPIGLVLAAVVALSVQQIRITGLEVSPFGVTLLDVEGWKSRAARHEAEAVKWRRSSDRWQFAHQQLAGDIQSARNEARARDRANALRVERAQQQAIERTSDAYEVRLADTRAALERLRLELDRAGAAAADSGRGGAADVPGAYTARCQALGATDCDTLLAALPGLLAEAETNTAKLIELQAYVEALLAIDWTGGDDVTSRRTVPQSSIG